MAPDPEKGLPFLFEFDSEKSEIRNPQSETAQTPEIAFAVFLII